MNFNQLLKEESETAYEKYLDVIKQVEDEDKGYSKELYTKFIKLMSEILNQELLGMKHRRVDIDAYFDDIEQSTYWKNFDGDEAAEIIRKELDVPRSDKQEAISIVPLGTKGAKREIKRVKDTSTKLPKKKFKL